jgi:AraC family transcriptional regulator, regulatory protein of adaptative response / methylated-DNA-[protein]-cysteine methyltransferase
MDTLLRTTHAARATASVPPRGDLPPLTADSDDARYAAVVARDASRDGAFYYAVRTTGVFCKPSCGARTPKRENVSFHLTIDAALAAGFRACKRCRPDQPADDLHREVITAVCRLIDDAIAHDQPTPTLDALARKSGFSSFHLHRLFRKATGITPRAYAAGARANRVRATLEDARTISEAIHAAGYGSSSRFYEHANQRLGMTPTQRKHGGRNETIRFAVGATSLGAMLVAATDKGICAIQLGDDPNALIRALEDRFPNATLIGDDDAFSTIVAQVVAWVESPRDALALPLDIRGTAFQERVWTALTAIAPGRTVTYTELAAAIGQPSAVRAVASACAANEIAIAIPCHRVVRSNGELSGYRWGVERKDALLRREGAR